MDIEEIKKYLNDNSETEEVKEFMESMKPQINIVVKLLKQLKVMQ